METPMNYQKNTNEVEYLPIKTEVEAQERAARSERRAKVALVIVFLLLTACVALTGVLHAIE
jgi:cytochrome bd-type quinol oxidase subunit 2